MRVFAIFVLVAMTIGACTCESEPVPGAPPDSGVPAQDATVDEDAPNADDDAVSIADAADAADAAIEDVDTSSDAGALDGTITSSDAGQLDDGAIPDSGIDDAGRPDIGMIDAGASDAGGLCSSTLDCLASGEVCGDLRTVAMSVETHCQAPNSGGAAIGGACTTDAQCYDGVCLTGIAGECSVVCEDAARDCPAGFSCTGYRYNPGMVWIDLCNRACADNDDCAGGAPGNFCSTQVFNRNMMWFVDRVCQAPPGNGALGSQCANGNDCQAGLCLTTTRNVTCMNNMDCMSDETCEMGACVSRLCSYLCDDASDCSAPNQSLVVCDPTIRLGLPDGTDAMISACARM